MQHLEHTASNAVRHVIGLAPPRTQARCHVGSRLAAPRLVTIKARATASIGMTRIAVQEREDGSTVDWLEQVSQEDYQAG